MNIVFYLMLLSVHIKIDTYKLSWEFIQSNIAGLILIKEKRNNYRVKEIILNTVCTHLQKPLLHLHFCLKQPNLKNFPGPIKIINHHKMNSKMCFQVRHVKRRLEKKTKIQLK